MEFLNSLGLIFDIVGAILLFIGTELINRQVVKLLNHVRRNYGTFDMGKISSAQNKEFDIYINLSNFWSRLGLFLLLVGFVLQLISSFK